MFLIRPLRHAYLEKSWHGGETVVRCLNKVLKKKETGHSIHLTDLRGGATHQFHKA